MSKANQTKTGPVQKERTVGKKSSKNKKGFGKWQPAARIRSVKQ